MILKEILKSNLSYQLFLKKGHMLRVAPVDV
jgi:hypothetical protein